MKRILVDARESGTSTGRYVDKLVEYMGKSNSVFLRDTRITILTKPQRIEYLQKVAPNFKIMASPFKEYTLQEQVGLLKQISSLAPDLVHFAKTEQPAFYKGVSITTIHDLTTARFSNPAKKPVIFKLKQIVYRWLIRRVSRKSKMIITPSRFVKEDVAQYTKVSPDKIVVTYEAADKISDKPEPIAVIDGNPFLLYVGRPNPHKNIRRLIDAYAEIKQEYPDLCLVLAGSADRNFELLKKYILAKGLIIVDNLTSQVDSAAGHEPGVYMTGFLPDAQLRWLYENCRAYVFPSLSEGFGLPGLEAMVHGAPVVSSNASCLPEIYGEAAHYFDPLNTDDIVKKIDEVLSDDKLREELIENGKIQATKYSWQKTAEQTLQVYRLVLSSNQA